MHARTVSWPIQGDTDAFRRRSIMLAVVAALVVVAPIMVVAVLNPAAVRSAIPLAIGMGALAALWIHGAARTYARQAEIERSFAGLSIVHLGQRYRVAERPVIGAYTSRRDAATAALERGSWAVIVRAWDRYWLLDAVPADAGAGAVDPVSFRSRAVADVIPAIRGEAIA